MAVQKNSRSQGPVKALHSKDQYLEGPKGRLFELKFSWNIFWQFINGFRHLHFIGPCITVFGSARFQVGHPYFKMAENIGKAIADMQFTVITGGGPGIMEAANKGAYENGGYSVGCNIQLPEEQDPNPYMHRWFTFQHFFVRKVLLLKYSYAFIVMPGGLGTMDELFETLTLVQTGIIRNFPVVLIGKDFYTPLMDYLHFMVAEKTISASDLDLVCLTDDIDEAMAHVQKFIKENYREVVKRKPRWWLLER